MRNPMLGREFLIISLILLLLAIFSFKRNYVWEDDLILWSWVASMSPGKARAHTNIGIAYDLMGEMDRAMEEYLSSIRLDPSYLYPYGPLAVIYGKKGDIETSIALFRNLLEKVPWDYRAHTGLGVAYMFNGQYMESQREFEEALRINPDYEVAKSNMLELKKRQQ